MMPRLLITDLDNTLYDWVTYFATSFAAMVEHLEPIVGADRATILADFKRVHQRYGTSEQPFAALELDCVTRKFAGASRAELRAALSPAFEAFSAARARTLALYEGVERTIQMLREEGVKVVGHTEAIAINAYYRLRHLGIADHFHHLYALEGHVLPHPTPGRERDLAAPDGFVTTVPITERKPNPALLLDICERERVPVAEAVYVGDSLTRDMSMAKAAGVKAVWARYGTHFDRSLWDILVSVTHWTAADVARENELRHQYEKVQPDMMIDSFAQLLPVFGVARP